MKDEELFKAWKSEQYKDQSDEERFEFVEHLHTFPKYFETTFLAGLKAGRPQWHKVADGDLPKAGVQVLSEKGSLVIYKGVGFNWVEYSPNEDNIKLRKWEEPIAWCEIPTFDKE